jgi:NAD(P)H-dependent flavin oxidoreductase YrpB (nitropropane dioxygenase family)
MIQPVIIQGGMGAAVSSWRLARAVSALGQLGVVSGTALDTVLVRRLQLGDPDGDARRAMDHFPVRAVADRVRETYLIPGGKGRGTDFRNLTMYTASPMPERQALSVLAGFVEVFLAKEGHSGRVGINFLEKIQLPTPAILYGALLAGVDYVLVGAGIPRDIPDLIERLMRHEAVSLPLHVKDANGERFELLFDPYEAVSVRGAEIPRPQFLAIVSSATLAMSLARRGGGVDGFVVEGWTAGGHNAPPRGPQTLNERGEPVYGPRDVADLAKIRALGLPFWLAGSYASPTRLREAQAAGAAGVQVGSAFAFCEESGLTPEIRRQVLSAVREGRVGVFTDPRASPTGFPFKVLELPGTLSDASVYEARARRCDLGYLRELYLRADGTIGYRCPAEPVEDYVRKGGDAAETVDRRCICNGLLANVGLGQTRSGYDEPEIVTAGDSVREIGALLRDGSDSYTAADVIAHLLERPPVRAAS